MCAAAGVAPQATNRNLAAPFLKTDGNWLSQLNLFSTTIGQIIQEGGRASLGLRKTTRDSPRQ